MKTMSEEEDLRILKEIGRRYDEKGRRKSELELILDRNNDEKNMDMCSSIYELRDYLKDGGEELSLEQYKQARKLVDEKYMALVKAGERYDRLTYSERQETARLLTDFLRDEHYRLLDIQKGIKVAAEKPEKKKGFFGRIASYAYGAVTEIKSNFDYKHNWKKKDNEMYLAERALWGYESGVDTGKIINKMPTKGLSEYKIKTIERMLPRAENKSKLSRILSRTKSWLMPEITILQQ